MRSCASRPHARMRPGDFLCGPFPGRACPRFGRPTLFLRDGDPCGSQRARLRTLLASMVPVRQPAHGLPPQPPQGVAGPSRPAALWRRGPPFVSVWDPRGPGPPFHRWRRVFSAGAGSAHYATTCSPGLMRACVPRSLGSDCFSKEPTPEAPLASTARAAPPPPAARDPCASARAP